MKFYRTSGAGGRTYLEPANKKYPILYPTTELVIIAVVKVVIRKF
jgi:SOS-response transcriptional repressor LexA